MKPDCITFNMFSIKAIEKAKLPFKWGKAEIKTETERSVILAFLKAFISRF